MFITWNWNIYFCGGKWPLSTTEVSVKLMYLYSLTRLTTTHNTADATVSWLQGEDQEKVRSGSSSN